MKSGQARVAVLIPHYNNLDGLLKTLSSIDESELVDVIIVDDGSSEKPSVNDLEGAFKASGKIYLHCMDVNVGITKALNFGLNMASQLGFIYVARLDAGDRNLGARFRQQETFMDQNPDCAVVGAWVNFVSVDGSLLFTLRHPISCAEIRRAIYRYNPFVHPSTMIRLSSILEVGGYPDSYPALEDWACFLDMSKKYSVANIPQVLLEYEVSPNSISTKKRFSQSLSKIKLLVKNYAPTLNNTMGIVKSLSILLLPRAALTVVKTFFMRRGR